MTIDIPNGAKNLPTNINWDGVTQYTIKTKFSNGATLTLTNYLNCCCNENNVRIHFVNALGRIDAINFNHKEETLEIKSDTWVKALQYPLNVQDGGTNRVNVRSNEAYKATSTCYGEKEMQWVKELFTTPRAWLETEIGFLPIVIFDKKIITIKKEDRYFYEVVIEYAMANENIHIRL